MNKNIWTCQHFLKLSSQAVSKQSQSFMIFLHICTLTLGWPNVLFSQDMSCFHVLSWQSWLFFIKWWKCPGFHYFSLGLEYLEKWMTPVEEFSTIMWMDMSGPPDWNDVEACIKYLREKGVPIDDAKCFDQVANLKKFIERCNSDEEFISLQVHQKWEGQRYFEKAKSIACYSELLNISQFVFALPSHNANVERVFSLMQSHGQRRGTSSLLSHWK